MKICRRADNQKADKEAAAAARTQQKAQEKADKAAATAAARAKRDADKVAADAVKAGTKRKRGEADSVDPSEWAADVQLPASVPGKGTKLRIEALGELRGERAFRLEGPGSRAEMLLAPVGFCSCREYDDPSLPKGKCMYLQQVTAPDGLAPRFSVQLQPDGKCFEADDPANAWSKMAV